ncbi:MAG TPA: SPFH domain-containing protein [Candidatus Dormibacteraeota bacterium]|nr:SPFH domain-containing protein [Candidatus Dormibacteraeota bacterium]
MDPGIIAAIVAAVVVLVVLASGLRVIAEFQRGVVLRFGRRGPLLDPGLRFILPLGLDRLIRVDLRSSLLEVPALEVITSEGVPVQVSASVHLQVLNPILAVTRVIDYRRSTSRLVQASLREVVGHTTLRALLVEPEAVRDALGTFLDARTEPWGIRITEIDVRDIELPSAMQRAMQDQAEVVARHQTEQIQADAEIATARRLAAAAEVLAGQPYALQLRLIQALTDMTNDKATVVVVPLPMDLVQPIVDLTGSGHAGQADAGGSSRSTGWPARRADQPR